MRKHNNKFFSVGNKKFFFNQYVGVIQVGNLIIEILPKADRDNTEDENKWHDALVHMLKVCKLIKLDSLTSAHLRTRSASLIDLYFETFINEVSLLLHRGLVKKYRLQEKNLNKLKGRIVFSTNLRKNYIHKERFYTAHQVYDKNNIFNKILKKALETVSNITSNQHLLSKTKKLLLSFEDVENINVSETLFNKISFERRTVDYKYAMNLARLILLNYSPDLKGGRDNILAILFDMNTLFEKFIYRLLKREESNYSYLNLSITGQASREFWQGKTIRPDIVIKYETCGEKK